MKLINSDIKIYIFLNLEIKYCLRGHGYFNNKNIVFLINTFIYIYILVLGS